jgi:(S)-sulfolactate dehydrogenase
MGRVVVPEFLPAEHVARLEVHFEVVYEPDLYADVERLRREVGTADAIVIRNRTRVDGGLLAAAPTLSVVGRLGVGLDNIDTEACAEAGVRVIPATGANSVSVAEYVFGALLTLARPVFGLTESMVAGVWPRQGHAFGVELMGKTLGLVGFGTIARHVARRALAFDMVVVAHDPLVPAEDPAWASVASVDMDELLRDADVVSLHVPLTEATRNLIDAATLARMKQGAILINTARGGVVDERALAAALRAGSLGGAALDVFASEPLEAGPAAAFAGLENLILTPHIAGNTVESVDRVGSMTVESVIRALTAGDDADPMSGVSGG